MDMICENNYVRLCGTVGGRPEYSHSSRGQRFYGFPLEVLRLSGYTDVLNIVVRDALLSGLELEQRQRLCVIGQLRTFNNRRGDGAKLVITVFARELFFTDDEDSNAVILNGTLCKTPNLRSTPMGRDICDLMVAVNRHYGRSDYLPCICWGSRAREASLWEVGAQVHIEGRMQSRKYIKLLPEGPAEKTAFEVSVTSIGPPESADGDL